MSIRPVDGDGEVSMNPETCQAWARQSRLVYQCDREPDHQSHVHEDEESGLRWFGGLYWVERFQALAAEKGLEAERLRQELARKVDLP